MLRAGVNRLRGQVRLRVEASFPERVLNLCGARDLAFWDLEWESPTAFTCRVSRRDLLSLRQAAEKLDCTLTVVEREGVPYFLRRFRHRAALMTGFVGCVLALFLGSFFVWEFTVEGNETVPEETILRALEKCGVGIGSFGLALDGEDIRNHVLLEVPELSWITVNVSGCRANVQVRERVPKPEMVDEQSPANVVARRAGLVLEVQALDGVKAVLPGTSVTEGQLLISGVEDTETFGAHLVAGMGSVRARTWYTFTTRIPLIAEKKQYTGKEWTGIALDLERRRIKFFPNSSIEGREYDKITKRIPVSFFDVPLPVVLTMETCRFYERVPVERDALQAEKLGETVLAEYLRAQVAPYGTVKSTLCTSRQKGDVLEVTLTAECEEQIGENVPILTEESDKSP